jgi:hypothetical protein
MANLDYSDFQKKFFPVKAKFPVKSRTLKPAKKPVFYYAQTIAKSCNEDFNIPGISVDDQAFDEYLRKRQSKEKPDKIYSCTKSMIWGETKKNNYYKLLTCGKEWCKDCGQMHSITHDRKINAIFPKFKRLILNEGKPVGYLIVTVPKELRNNFRNQKVLNDFRTYWRRKLKRFGANCGLIRYHWSGEDGYHWHPHLNILFPQDWIELETLKNWRAELSNWFKDYFNLNYNPKSNLYYSFTYEIGKLNHWVSYVTRPTQIKYNKWNESTIKGYRNTAPFGKFPDPTEEEITAATTETNGFEIHEDGSREKIVWRKKYNQIKQKWELETISILFIRTNDLICEGRGFFREEKFSINCRGKKPPPV